MSQDTGKFRKNTKDQYYTKPSVAAKCVATIQGMISNLESYQWIEPSAGKGAFLKALPASIDRIGLDLEPGSSDIVRADFLTWTPSDTKKRIFFGNPPFGPQGCLAKAFIKHAAAYGSILAFILPRSFVKPSMNRAFPLNFHCIYSEELEENAFEVSGVEHNVPCVFQIWIQKTTNRVVEAAIEPLGFTYVKGNQPFDIAIKRVGGKAGTCSKEPEPNQNTHYFLKLEERYRTHIVKIIEQLEQHTFPSNTVGPRSLSKSEINQELNRILC